MGLDDKKSGIVRWLVSVRGYNLKQILDQLMVNYG